MMDIASLLRNASFRPQLEQALQLGLDHIVIRAENGKEVGRMTVSPDLIRSYLKIQDDIKRDDEIADARRKNVEEEEKQVGNEILPIGQEVEINGGLRGRIEEVTKGFMERPYYRVFLQNAEGQYGDPKVESNYGYFYARQLRNYGRGV